MKAKYYLLPAALCLAAVTTLGYYYTMTGFSRLAHTTYVYIDGDDTPDSVFAQLDTIARSHAMTGLRTLLRHSSYHEHLRTGRYAIEPGTSTYSVFLTLKNGHQAPLQLTISEAKTPQMLAGRLAHKLMLDSLTLLQRIEEDSAMSLFVPDTYEVYWNIGIDAFMDRMQREHDRFWDAGQRRQKATDKGLTPHQVCTLASIIDEETANNAEKPMIAGMYLNRLRVGMPLQADPTVKYAVGDFSLRRIYNTHLQTDSPYNTYLHAGLPPGPIKIASQKGIDAVLNATPHNFLYMCAKEDFSGTHNFAQTYQEHLKNAARYAQALNKRGIR